MQLGLHIGYADGRLTPAEQAAVVREAEQLGFDSVWTAEAYGVDAATPLAWLAAQTSSIRLGAAVFQIPGRSAAMTAMTAASIDRLSDGRMILGLGASGPQVSEGWHGVRFANQLRRTREYVEVVRMALERRQLRYSGKTIELPLPDGPGKPLKLIGHPVQDRIPIYLAAMGPKNTALAGELADGWIPVLMSPEHMDLFTPALQTGAGAAGRSLDGFDIAPLISVRIDEDHAAARDEMRPGLALYLGGMGSREKNFYNQLAGRYGFEEPARRVQDLYLDGRRKEAMAAIPDALIDLVCICGPRDHVRERLRLCRAAGVGTLMVSLVSPTATEQIEQARLLAQLADQAG